MKRRHYPKGHVWDVKMQMEPPPFVREQRLRGRRGQGLAYEAKVHEEFLRRYHGYLPSPWFSFKDDAGYRKWCQTDGLLVDPFHGKITIIEIKYQHTAQAYDQLFHLYTPVLRARFAGIYDIACCEVVKWFDCATLCPVNPTLCDDPQHARENVFNVHIWRPRHAQEESQAQKEVPVRAEVLGV